MKKLLIGAGIAGVLGFVLLAGVIAALAFGAVPAAFAQGPTPNPGGVPGDAGCVNGTATLDLLKMNGQDLLKERQAGKSLLDIAKAKGVDEPALTNSLMQPVATMHAWMGQQFGNQAYVDQMTQWMKDWIAKDIRQTQFGTMTDFRLGLGGSGSGYEMMGGNGMMGSYGSGNGMMGGWDGTGANGTQPNQPGGFRGMMGGWRQ